MSDPKKITEGNAKGLEEIGRIGPPLTTVKAAQRRHERMLCADEAAQKEALTRDGHFAGRTISSLIAGLIGAGLALTPCTVRFVRSSESRAAAG